MDLKTSIDLELELKGKSRLTQSLEITTQTVEFDGNNIQEL